MLIFLIIYTQLIRQAEQIYEACEQDITYYCVKPLATPSVWPLTSLSIRPPVIVYTGVSYKSYL